MPTIRLTVCCPTRLRNLYFRFHRKRATQITGSRCSHFSEEERSQRDERVLLPQRQGVDPARSFHHPPPRERGPRVAADGDRLGV